MPRARNFFMGLGTGLTDQLDQQQKIKQIFAAALAQEQAKAQFDPEMQAKQQLLQMANQAGQIPGQLQPASPGMPGAGASVLQGQAPSAGAANVGAFQQAQQQAQQNRQAILQLLTGKSGQSGITFQMNDKGQATPVTTPSGQTVSTRNKIMPRAGGGKSLDQLTAESAARATGSEMGRLQATQRQLAGRFSNGLDVIQQNLDALNNTVSATMKQSPGNYTTEAHLRAKLGTYDPTFRRAQSTIEAQLGLFAQALEAVPGGRAAQGLMQNMSNLLKDTVFLPPAEAAKNMQTARQLMGQINKMVESQGVQNTGNDIGSPADDDPVIRTGFDNVTKRRVGQTRSGKVVPL